MQVQSRRSSICLFCAVASRARPVLPRPATSGAVSLHTSSPLSRQPSSRSKGHVRPTRNASGVLTFSPMGPKKPLKLDPPDRHRIPSHIVRLRILERLEHMKPTANEAHLLDSLGLSGEEKKKAWKEFTAWVVESQRKLERRDHLSGEDEESVKLWDTLEETFRNRHFSGVDKQLQYSFFGYVASRKYFSRNDFQNQKALADLRYPTEWFPATRKIQRRIICHVGPTNSGKTYHALKRLEQAKRGVYAGPLRLLAHEVYTRLNAKGLSCSLVTGEERRLPTAESESQLYSCTVEMIPLAGELDVAVIDEIQMISNVERGWAWTQALLGVQAKEIHLCGEERTVPLLRELAAAMGDKFEVNTYNRLSPLQMDKKVIDNDWKNLRKGDCIVAFSVMNIHALRRDIERRTLRKVAIVYGSLPPETRAAQARLFNDPNNDYDYLVASDAIGMGLNLSIKRVIFESTSKFNGYEEVPLKIADIKQIAGRAGRYRSAHQANEAAQREQELMASKADASTAASAEGQEPEAYSDQASPIPPKQPETSVGLVTTIERADYRVVRAAMNTDPEPIRTAGLYPPDSIIERFASYFPPGTPFSYILLRLHEISRIHTRFHMCMLRDQLLVADSIQDVPGLTTLDRIVFCASPASVKWPHERELLKNLAKCVAEQRNGSLLDIEGFEFEVLDRPPSPHRDYLSALETLHKGLVLYLWLSYRFAGVFTTRALAFHAKHLVEQAIEHTLREFSEAKGYAERRAARDRWKNQMLENYRREFMVAEEPQKARKEKAPDYVAEGSRYEQDDVLDDSMDVMDGAEEGDDVHPTTHEEETQTAVEGVNELPSLAEEKEQDSEKEKGEEGIDASSLDDPMPEVETAEDIKPPLEEQGDTKKEPEIGDDTFNLEKGR